jgi:hypothetical protein
MELLFEHPDSQDFFRRTYSLLMSEADRGCILLGVSLLDEELTRMFELLLPPEASNNRKKEIFDGKGAFGSLSAKLDIAYVCRILPPDLVDCMHLLRKLRNKLAHNSSSFTLDENTELIFEIFEKTEGNLAVGVAHMSLEFVYGQFLKNVMNANHPSDEGKKLFNSREEAIEFLRDSDDVKAKLAEQKIKTMFVLGVACLGALIIFHRERAKGVFASQA